MIPTKDINQSIPITPEEIIEQTHQAYEIGITIVHLHARLNNEQPTYERAVYQKIIEGVRKHCKDLIICVSTSGRTCPDFDKRSEVLELYPDMASLTLSSLNFSQSASLNQPDVILALIDKMLKFGVTPELECFDLGMVNYGNYLLKKKSMAQPCYWNLIFGNIFGAQPTFSQLGAMLSEIPDNHYISMGGIGSYQLQTNALAIAYGLGVRVGLEDNIWFDSARTKQATNISLLKRVHQLMEIHQRELMPGQELGFYNKYRET